MSETRKAYTMESAVRRCEELGYVPLNILLNNIRRAETGTYLSKNHLIEEVIFTKLLEALETLVATFRREHPDRFFENYDKLIAEAKGQSNEKPA